MSRYCLYLEVIRKCRKVSLITSEDAPHRIGKTGIGRHLSRIIDGIGKDAGLFRLAFLIDAEQRMAEHGSRVVQKGRGKDQRNGLGIKILVPPVESFAGDRRKPDRIKLQLLFQPMIPSDEGALSRLPSAANRLNGEELCKGGRKLGS